MSKLPTYTELLAVWLKDNGYDGLYFPGECACLRDDLAPCNNEPEEIRACSPGYRTDKCDGRCPSPHDCSFHIVPEKEAR